MQPSHVRSTPISSAPARKSRIGFLRPGHVESAFIMLLYLALLVLVLLSILGTFYGQRGLSAPITAPARMVRDVFGAPSQFGIALGIQGILTLIQYGARQMARRDRRWWILYLVSLGISVYYNVQAYWIPLTALVPFYLAGLLIVAGDVLPEFIAVRHD